MGDGRPRIRRHALDDHITGIAKKLWFSTLLIVVVLALGVGIAFWATRPPSPPSQGDSDSPAFSRMLANIQAMTVKSHPSGSRELADVRAYLLAQITGMGLKYDLMSSVCSVADVAADEAARNGEKRQLSPPQGAIPAPGSAVNTTPEDGIRGDAVFDNNDELTLYNVLVKLDAPGTDRGVLFLAHYDGEFGDPGACDDMTSVCALLEAMRKQATNPDLRSDLYFLFTDGEELGAMGAKAFVRDNPGLAGRIDLVVNLDARGTSGGLLMFETSQGDYPQVKYLQAASSHPLSYSWLPMVYRRMPNGTDLMRFLDAGFHGLNFAVAEGVQNYGSSTDDLDHLDRGTAYNFLQTTFELSDRAASAPPGDTGSNQDGVYFTLLPGLLVVMTGLVARILAGVAVLAALAWLTWELGHRRVRPLRVLRSAGFQLLVIVVAAAVGWGAATLIDKMGLFQLPSDDMRYNVPAFLGIAAVIGAGVLAGFALLTRKRALSETLAGLLPLLILATAVTAVMFNAAGYLFTFPTLGLVVVALLVEAPFASRLLGAVVGIGALLLYVPVAWLLFVTLGFAVLPIVIAVAAFPLTLIAVMLCGPVDTPTNRTIAHRAAV